MDDATRFKASEKVSARLQTQCQKFIDYTKQFAKGDWKAVQGCPTSTASMAELDKFFAIKKFWYLEASNDTTFVTLTDTSWVDHIKNGTYSKLALARTSPFDFTLSFIESNHLLKSSMGKKGDTYNYSIISAGNKSYLMCVSRATVDKAMLFKLYYK